MKSDQRKDILISGLIGIIASAGYFASLNSQIVFRNVQVAVYIICLSAVLGLALHLTYRCFDMDAFFRFHLLVVICAIIFGIRQNSLILFSIMIAVVIVFPPILWGVYKKRYPRIAPVESPLSSIQKPKYSLRSEPIEFSEAEIEVKLSVRRDSGTFKNLNLVVWRPHIYVENEFSDNGDGTVTDRATGLMWQQSGSENRMTYNNVQAYVDKINLDKLGGYEDWRLPTIEELASLLENEEKNDDLYIDPVFDDKQWWCWSSDRRSGGGVWYVNFNYGSINWYSGLYNVSVRLVRPSQ